MRIELKKNSLGRDVHTLAQSRTPLFDKMIQLPAVTVKGKGVNLANNEQLQKWAKRKLVTMNMVRRLVDVAKEFGDTEFVEQCWDTYHCLGSVYMSNGRMYSKYGYCKNRHCTLCCCIRKAELINKYAPYLKKNWAQAYFVTLTVKAAYVDRLNHRIDEMYRVFNGIVAKYRRLNKKGKAIRLQGIRSFECLFNPTKQWYHVHFHLVVPNKEAAEILKKEWMTYWGRAYASPRAQDIRPVWNMEGALDEVIKYGSKIFTEPDEDKKLLGMVNPKIYGRAFYHIYKAMKGRRIFDRFGFNLPKSVTPRRVTFTELTEFREWAFDPITADYINEELDLPLIGYTMDPVLVYLLRNCIDILLE